jgi:hypothetical protein
MDIKEHKVTVANYDCYSENEYEYDDYIYEMVAALKNMSCSVWDIEVSNGNWRGQTGYMTSSDPEKIAHALLMHDGNCRTEVWMGYNHGDGLSGVCYHHDAPTGSWFTIKINEDE